VNVSNFLTPPDPSLDKRSSKADEFSITHHPATSDKLEHYTVRANLSKDLQVSCEVTRPEGVPGFKVGNGPKGGYSYFGPDKEKPEGYVIHRFWPRTEAHGHVIHKGQALAFKGPGMFVHAIQGMSRTWSLHVGTLPTSSPTPMAASVRSRWSSQHVRRMEGWERARAESASTSAG